MALLDLLNVGTEMSTPKPPQRQTLMVDTGSRSSFLNILSKVPKEPNMQLSYNIVASRTKEDLIKRLDMRNTSHHDLTMTGKLNTSEISDLRILKETKTERGSLVNKEKDRVEPKIRNTLGNLRNMKTMGEPATKVNLNGLGSNLIRPTFTLQPHFLNYAELGAPQRHFVPIPASPQPAPQRFNFTYRPTNQPPMNLRSLVSNMELLRVPSRVLRYNNDHMLKSLGYCYDDSKSRSLSKPIVHSSVQSLQRRQGPSPPTQHFHSIRNLN